MSQFVCSHRVWDIEDGMGDAEWMESMDADREGRDAIIIYEIFDSMLCRILMN